MAKLNSVSTFWVSALCLTIFTTSNVNAANNNKPLIQKTKLENSTIHKTNSKINEITLNPEESTPKEKQAEEVYLTPEEALLKFMNVDQTESNVTIDDNQQESSKQPNSTSMGLDTPSNYLEHSDIKESRILDIPFVPEVTKARPLDPSTNVYIEEDEIENSSTEKEDIPKHLIPASESVRKERGIYVGGFGDQYDSFGNQGDYGYYDNHKGYGDKGHYGSKGKGGFGYGEQHGNKHGYSKGYSKGYEHKYSHAYGHDHGQKYGEGHGYGQKHYGHGGYGQRHYGLHNSHGNGYGGYGLGHRRYGFGFGRFHPGLGGFGGGLGGFGGGLGLGGFGGGLIGYMRGPMGFGSYGYHGYNPWYMY